MYCLVAFFGEETAPQKQRKTAKKKASQPGIGTTMKFTQKLFNPIAGASAVSLGRRLVRYS